MTFLNRLYGGSLSLLTDLYQLTMAYGYWATEARDKEAVYHLFFRKAPFEGTLAIAAGLEQAIEYLRNLRYTDEDVAYLARLQGNDGEPLFSQPFLDYLRTFEFSCDVDAVPEGTAVFANEPLLRVRGPIIQCQLLETSLLNLINFQTLIATKAARVRHAAGDDLILEFGLRRAQGIDGGVSAARAAYLGGADGTSNVLAGKLFDIPVRGTHAHSWVMAFDSEAAAFDAYARALPNNAIFLVDTYDTIEGVARAIEAGRKLRERGYDMAGVRLDSGDVAKLARQARHRLDEAGFRDTRIVASGDLDEHRIREFKDSGVPITVWGVGTRLVTGDVDSALNGVYKLAAVRDPGGDWQYRLKLSNSSGKISNPGILQIRRHALDGRFVADEIFDEGPLGAEHRAFHGNGPDNPACSLPAADASEDLLVPVFRGGDPVYPQPALPAIRERAMTQYAAFAEYGKNGYPVGLERRLQEKKNALIARLRR